MTERLPQPGSNPASQEGQEKATQPTTDIDRGEAATQPKVQETALERSKAEEKPSSAEDFRKDFARLKANENFGYEVEGQKWRRLRQAVSDRRTELSKEGRNEQDQLQEARAKLGLPVPSQESYAGRALAHELHDLDALDQDIQSELREGRKAEESLERERGLKEGARNAGEATAMFAREINSRERDGMDAFIDPRAYNQLRSGAVALAEFAEGKGKVDMNELHLAFVRINSGLENMHKTRSRGPVRESEDSLGKLGYAMRSFHEATVKMSRNFREGDEQASGGARRLIETSERVYDFTSRLRSALRNMR